MVAGRWRDRLTYSTVGAIGPVRASLGIFGSGAAIIAIAVRSVVAGVCAVQRLAAVRVPALAFAPINVVGSQGPNVLAECGVEIRIPRCVAQPVLCRWPASAAICNVCAERTIGVLGSETAVVAESIG